MIEFVLIVAFIIIARRFNRVARAPQMIRLDVHHHFHDVPGPGDPVEEPQPSAEVVPIASQRQPQLRIVR